ncbi:MAG: signal transduction histidine kinase [Polaribacter sp.]|jgi:signal transduction histidine kinase
MNVKEKTRNTLLNNWLVNKKHKRCICGVMVLLFSIQTSFGMILQKEVDASLDVQQIIIDKNTKIALDSGWEFYWNELIVPGSFKGKEPSAIVSLTNWTTFKLPNIGKLPSFGYATYRLCIAIPKERPHVSLHIPKAYSSSKLWINGKLISEIGHVEKTKTSALQRRYSQIIPLNTEDTTFEIVVQVSNYYHHKAGLDKPLILGASAHIYTTKYKLIMADMLFIGCIGFMGVFFLFFFIFYWNKDQAVIYFSILCISLIYMTLSDRYAPQIEIFSSISWILLTKTEYIAFFTAGVSSGLFVNKILPDFFHKAYPKILVLCFCFFVMLNILLFAPHFTKLITPFLILMVINFIYMTVIILKAILVKQYESILLLSCLLLGSIIFYFHVIFFLGGNGNEIIYVNFGYIFVFLLLSMLLMKRFSDSFQELERSKELALLQKKEISIQSDQVSNLNQELGQNLKLLENYNQELDDFNHIVSHDLKSPLIALHALASFIEEDLKMTMNKETKNHLTLLKDVVSKMDALINGLLEYSKIAKGNKSKEPFRLNELLSNLKTVVDYQNKSTINLPVDDLEIHANKVELEHVFQNLISNSIKHNDKEHAIINISVYKGLKKYVFSVSDNGPGINPKYHTKIFKMFSQLNENSDVESTGIGLAIVNKIIYKNDGVISVKSEEGSGLTISFSWKI